MTAIDELETLFDRAEYIQSTAIDAVNSGGCGLK